MNPSSTVRRSLRVGRERGSTSLPLAYAKMSRSAIRSGDVVESRVWLVREGRRGRKRD